MTLGEKKAILLTEIADLHHREFVAIGNPAQPNWIFDSTELEKLSLPQLQSYYNTLDAKVEEYETIRQSLDSMSGPVNAKLQAIREELQ